MRTLTEVNIDIDKTRNATNILIEERDQILIAENYELFKRQFEGKFFKLRNNYSCPETKEDYWFLYTHITSITEESLYASCDGRVLCHCNGWSFQTDKYGNISISKVENGYTHSVGKEITKKEFDSAYELMLSKIQQLKTK